MSQRKFKSSIDFLKKCFSSSEEGLETLSKLEELGKSLDFTESPRLLDGSFPVPVEVKGKSDSFALFSDGACRGNPGPGSWGMMAQNNSGDLIFEGSGVTLSTTNNRMELEGALKALEDLLTYLADINFEGEPEVYLYSDSKYVVDGLKSWLVNWKKRGWKTAGNKSPVNMDLWKEIDQVQ
ncbi:MAG: ribonuclease HI, partial [Halobacteriovoraceae bacterium]|nr:ribonuclease HI [Halobacteriovoraceae bacterium]